MAEKKMTIGILTQKVNQLRKETCFQVSFRILPDKKVYRIVLTHGLSGETSLFGGKAFTVREAAAAVDMLILARQLNWHFPSVPPIKWARAGAHSVNINDW